MSEAVAFEDTRDRGAGAAGLDVDRRTTGAVRTTERAHSTRALQRTIGNAQLCRVLRAAKPDSMMTSEAAPAAVEAAGDSAGSSPIKRKQCRCDDASGASDMCTECAEQQGTVQRYATQAGGPSHLPPSVTQAIQGGGGERLPDANRAHMESALGADLSDVRIHKGPDAAHAASDINARAFTVGQDVYFGAGQYDPGTKRGNHLLGHELTHTLQQAGGNVTTQTDVSISSPADPLEREAETVAGSISTPREPTPSPQQPIRPRLTTQPTVQGAWYDFAVEAGEWVGGKVEAGASAAWQGAKWVGGKAEAGAEAAWEGAKWVGGKVEAGAGAAWRGAKRVGGWIKDEAERVGGAAWECLKITGGSMGDLLTGHLPSLRDLLQIPKPADDSPIGVMDVIMAVVRHPCVRMIPGYPLFAKAASKLQDVYAFLKGAWALVKDPDRITSAIRDALAPMISEVAGQSRELVEKALASIPTLRKHLAGIWRHLEPKLEDFAANWWDTLKKTAWEFVWPWDGISGELAAIWEDIKKAGSDIWALDVSSATDDILAVWRKANGLIGRLYGWLLIASVLIGAIVGAFFGGVGAIPGAIAGFEFAMAVGEALLISTVAAEGLTIAKAIFDLANGEQTEKKNDEDYELIANSSLTLGITGVFYVLGAIAARFARGVISRVARLFRRSGEPIPPQLPRPTDPVRPVSDEPVKPAPRPTEVPAEEVASLHEKVKSPDNIDPVTDPAFSAKYDAEIKIDDHTYRRSRTDGTWCRFSPATCGIKLGELNADVDAALGKKAAKAPKVGEEPSKAAEEAPKSETEGEAARAAKEAEAKARAEAELGPDGKFRSAELEAAYERYVARKGKAGQDPRGRVDWKVARDYWLTDSPMARGNKFNTTRGGEYPFNEVHLENGKRLDSYRPPEAGQPGEIVSRKATDFDEIEPETFDRYLKEMKAKYEPGTKIRSNKYGPIDGQPLEGKQILEVPDSNLKAANRKAFEVAAKKQGIEIRYAPE